MSSNPSGSAARSWWARLRDLHRLGRGRMTVEEYEQKNPDDGMCRRYGHVAVMSDLHTCTVCGSRMP